MNRRPRVSVWLPVVLALSVVLTTFAATARAQDADVCNCRDGNCGGSGKVAITNLKQPDIIVTTEKDNEALRRQILGGMFPNVKIVAGNLKYVIGMIKAHADSVNRKVHVLIDGHGSSGSQQVGHEYMGHADTTELRFQTTFVNVLSGKLANLELLGCSVADGTTGQEFLSKLSADLGNIPIKAFTGVVELQKRGTVYSVSVIDGAKKDVTVLANDNFSYPNGNLVLSGGANGGWYANSGAGVGPVQVVDGQVAIHEGTGFNEDASKPFVMQSAAAKTYASFTIKLNSGTLVAGPTGPGTPQYFAHFRTGTSDSTSAFRARVYILTPQHAGHYTVGISATTFNAGTQPAVPWVNDLTFGVTYRVVTAYDAATGTATLWIDPMSESSSNVQSNSASAIGSQVAFYALRQGTPSDGTNISVLVDDIAVATKFPESDRVPGMGVWGMLILSAVLFATGARMWRRTRLNLA